MDHDVASANSPAVDYDALRARLAGQSGPAYWRSLDDLANGHIIDEAVHKEFPSSVTDTLDPVSRRNFMKVMGASVMLAGLANCARQPDEKVVGYVNQPENLIPGKAQFFATATAIGGYGLGLLATSHMNRPTKLEGLKEHPSSVGRTDAWSQATILDMYDPDRLDTVLEGETPSTWSSLAAVLDKLRPGIQGNQGAGLRILTETATSPTLKRMMEAVLAEYPKANWHQYEPANRDNVTDGAVNAFGRPVETTYEFAKAKVVLALDADFLANGPGRVRYIADFADARDADSGHGMNRLYVAESSPTLTGANADHRAALRFSQVETLARVVALRLGTAGVDVNEEAANALPAGYVSTLVDDLKANKGAGIVLAGPEQPAAVHQLAHAINQALGNTGTTVIHREPVQAKPENQTQSLAALAEAVKGGQVNVLLIIGGNPAFSAPSDMDFAGALGGMTGRLRIHLTSHPNETSALCDWSVPEAHFLESWGDLRAHDGTVSIVQPIIQPLYADAKSGIELLATLLGDAGAKGYDLVRQTWQPLWEGSFDTQWKRALMNGVVANTAAAPAQVKANTEFGAHTPAAQDELDLLFRVDPCIFDGRWVNNGWLMELPHPLTKHTWDNVVLMGPGTATRLGVGTDDLVSVSYRGRAVEGSVLVQFGHPEGAVTLHLGFGRERTGKVGTGTGFNTYGIRTSDALWNTTGATVQATGGTRKVARTEDHYLIEQSVNAERRHLIREATLEHFEEHPDFAAHMGHHAPADDFTLYNPKEKDFGGHQWGMTIDLNRCVGCNACITACQSENNIPIVGREQVIRGREMHWIRVDRYYKALSEADFDQPETAFQPLPCMHCENAPCEPVCPVGATMHSKEGLNDMVYNRCIGTRYCLNNCPYKVRRFNFFHFNIREGQDRAQLKLIKNPNVTVRSRGVMEKCTYCVQRINAARIEAKKKDRYIDDGEVVTACQSACPAGAIVFGNINDAKSAVTKMKANPRNYGLIADIGTRPRTSYLAKLRNPSPRLQKAHGGHGGDSDSESHGENGQGNGAHH